jgi:hypothetical protein
MLNKTMKWFLALSAATLGSAAAAVAYMTRRALYDALPSVQGSQELHGLRRPVEIIRDRWGVPHIYAQTEEDGILGMALPGAPSWPGASLSTGRRSYCACGWSRNWARKKRPI